MSSTNKTVTIELSQYVGTDKPTYLVDYNGDMLKIDNAIAADRDSIQTAQSKADEADSKIARHQQQGDRKNKTMLLCFSSFIFGVHGHELPFRLCGTFSPGNTL